MCSSKHLGWKSIGFKNKGKELGLGLGFRGRQGVPSTCTHTHARTHTVPSTCTHTLC